MGKKKSKVNPLDAIDAGQLTLAVAEYAKKKGWLLAIAAYTVDQKEVSFLSMLGTRNMTNKIACAKAQVSASSGMATEEVKSGLSDGSLTKDLFEKTMAAGLSRIGGQPIYYKGVLLGGIGASNMAGHEDREAVRAALEEYGYELVPIAS